MTEKDIQQLVSLYDLLDGYLTDEEMSETVATILDTLKSNLLGEMQMRLDKDDMEGTVQEAANSLNESLRNESVEEVRTDIKNHLGYVIYIAEHKGLDEIARKARKLKEEFIIGT